MSSIQRLLVGTACCLALVGAACSSEGDSTAGGESAEAPSPAPDNPNFPSGWTPDPLEWDECDRAAYASIECATLEVPLDWDEPDGEQIELALGRREPSGDAIGPLLSNPGGPGGSGIEYLAFGSFTSELTERFDLVSWDPRGVGDSTPIKCDASIQDLWAADSGPDDDTERTEIEEAASAVAADCAAAEGEYLEHVHTANVARDLEAIRRALGGDPLNYIGFSYGTHIGQLYADMFGENLRAMVLDGVVDPALAFEDFLLGQTAAFDAAFMRHAELCSQAGQQSCGVEDLLDAYDTVAAELEQSPGDSVYGPVGPSELATAAAYVGYQDGGWQPMGEALAEALDGDLDGIRGLAESYRSFAAYGPYAAVVCTDSERPMDFESYLQFEQRAIEVSERFGAAIANEMLPCAVWGADPQGNAGAVSAPDAPPILVVGNTGDPATPLENAEAVAASLDTAYLLVVDMEGHVAFGSNACATRIIEDYLVDLTLPDSGEVC
ncbi:MAG: alpha/beta hydrolase [Microthrixaceae bacterium]